MPVDEQSSRSVGFTGRQGFGFLGAAAAGLSPCLVPHTASQSRRLRPAGRSQESCAHPAGDVAGALGRACVPRARRDVDRIGDGVVEAGGDGRLPVCVVSCSGGEVGAVFRFRQQRRQQRRQRQRWRRQRAAKQQPGRHAAQRTARIAAAAGGPRTSPHSTRPQTAHPSRKQSRRSGGRRRGSRRSPRGPRQPRARTRWGRWSARNC